MYTGTCLPSLSVIKTALIASLAAAKYTISSSFSLGAVSIWEFCDELLHLFVGCFCLLSPLEVTLFCALFQGGHPSRIFKRCSAMLRGTPVISAGFQAKTSKFCPSRVHSSLCPFSVRVDPMAIVYSGMILLLRNVTVPPSTGNFSIPCDVGGMARIFLIPGLPIILLCWDSDLTTMKFIHAEVECPSLPIFTSKDIWPNG
ncbi:hypothetical protein Tco_1164106 [Tanacetum coccineum]